MSNPAQPIETLIKDLIVRSDIVKPDRTVDESMWLVTELAALVRERMEAFADDFRKGYYQSDDDNPDDRVDEAIDYALARHLGEPTPVSDKE